MVGGEFSQVQIVRIETLIAELEGPEAAVQMLLAANGVQAGPTVPRESPELEALVGVLSAVDGVRRVCFVQD